VGQGVCDPCTDYKAFRIKSKLPSDTEIAMRGLQFYKKAGMHVRSDKCFLHF